MTNKQRKVHEKSLNKDKHIYLTNFIGIVDGLRATNTTLDRPGGITAEEQGGLSGKPLYKKSCEVVDHFRRLLPPNFPIVGVGGIATESAATEMSLAGADLLQIYTSFIYQGTKIVHLLSRI